jgi:ATP-binding cassette subfamily B multidrug efflux pump
MALLRLLRTYLSAYRRPLAGVMVFQAIQAIAALYLPRLNAEIIDSVVVRNDRGVIWTTGTMMVLATIGQAMFAVAATYCGARAAAGMARDLRNDLFHQVTDFSAREVDSFGAPSLITRITNDVLQVQMVVVMSCTMLVAAPVTIVGGVVMALLQDVGLTWVLVVSLPALVLCLVLLITRMVPQYRLMQLRIDAINGVLREQITGMRVVRAFVREPHEAKRFADVNEKLTKTSLRAARLQAIQFPTLMLFINVSSVGVLWVGGGRVAQGTTTVGSLIAFLTYLSLILVAVMMASMVVMMAPRAAVCAERINEVLDTSTSVVISDHAVSEVSGHGLLELDGVGFTHPGAEEPVLCDITLRCAPGTTTAIIGSTGAGKTTLVNLVARLIDVTDGVVRLDGVDVRDLEPEALWSRIGLVPQRPFLFSGTVATNLRFGQPEATDEELWAALDVAQASSFVRAMPGGLDAPITQGGANVSGGQRQRLAIARALVKRPEIYLFDDSFSALDLATDARLRAALAPHTAEAAVLIVAQRVSTTKGADQVLVLEDGRAVGLGTHEELLATCPTYQEIVESQATEQRAA